MLCKIWVNHGDDKKECRLMGYENQVRTSWETHFFTTEPSPLMLYKIWSFTAGNYEERRLLGYKYPVRTVHEIHYVSITKPNRLILCKIWGLHDGDYEECCLLRCDAVWLVRTKVSEERIASIIRVTTIGELGTLAVTSNRSTLQRNT
jgi:hypothetical protein